MTPRRGSEDTAMRTLRQWIGLSVVGIFAATAVAEAQTTTPTAPTNEGAYESLSPGNQKIVRAIDESQKVGAAPKTTFKPLSRDDIAAMKKDGHGWGQVYEQLRSQGLVHEKNLGQTISKYNQQKNHETSTTTRITTASGRTQVASGTGKVQRVATLGKNPKATNSHGPGASISSASGHGYGRVASAGGSDFAGSAGAHSGQSKSGK